MSISVIVSTYTKNRLNDVLRCLNSLNAQTLKPDEVLLVLDPDDNLVNFYRNKVNDEFEFDFKVIRSNKPGLSEARNVGIDSSEGELIAFIDDDAWADRRWLDNLTKPFKDKKVWGVGGKIVPKFDEDRPKWLAEELDWIVGCTYRGMPRKIRNPIGANMCFRRVAFETVGKFRSEVGRMGSKLVSGEEAEFSMRLKKMKPEVKYFYAEDAVVYHRVPKSRCKITYALKRAYYEGYSKAILSREYDLGVESRYLRFLLNSLVKKTLNLRFAEVVGILMVIGAVALGNAVCRLKCHEMHKN